MKFLVCLVAVLAAFASADEEPKRIEKRGIIGGYGGYGLGYGGYGGYGLGYGGYGGYGLGYGIAAAPVAVARVATPVITRVATPIAVAAPIHAAPVAVAAPVYYGGHGGYLGGYGGYGYGGFGYGGLGFRKFH